MQRERCRAAAESRLALTGGAAYRGVPLTGAFQAAFPAYRQRSSFGHLGDASQIISGGDAAVLGRCLRDLFTLDPHGQIVEVIKPGGSTASAEDLEADAQEWASHFMLEVFHHHCTNHGHHFTATCIKYVKNNFEAKQNLRSNEVPCCRFLYFRVKLLNGERLRRRGKPLVEMLYIYGILSIKVIGRM